MITSLANCLPSYDIMIRSSISTFSNQVIIECALKSLGAALKLCDHCCIPYFFVHIQKLFYNSIKNFYQQYHILIIRFDIRKACSNGSSMCKCMPILNERFSRSFYLFSMFIPINRL